MNKLSSLRLAVVLEEVAITFSHPTTKEWELLGQIGHAEPCSKEVQAQRISMIMALLQRTISRRISRCNPWVQSRMSAGKLQLSKRVELNRWLLPTLPVRWRVLLTLTNSKTWRSPRWWLTTATRTRPTINSNMSITRLKKEREPLSKQACNLIVDILRDT